MDCYKWDVWNITTMNKSKLTGGKSFLFGTSLDEIAIPSCVNVVCCVIRKYN